MSTKAKGATIVQQPAMPEAFARRNSEIWNSADQKIRGAVTILVEKQQPFSKNDLAKLAGVSRSTLDNHPLCWQNVQKELESKAQSAAGRETNQAVEVSVVPDRPVSSAVDKNSYSMYFLRVLCELFSKFMTSIRKVLNQRLSEHS